MEDRLGLGAEVRGLQSPSTAAAHIPPTLSADTASPYILSPSGGGTNTGDKERCEAPETTEGHMLQGLGFAVQQP
jgi:hypothetical protein